MASTFSTLTPIGWLVIQFLLFGLLLILFNDKLNFSIQSASLSTPSAGKQWFKTMSLPPIALIGITSLIFAIVLSGLIQYFTPISSLIYTDERMYHASRVLYWLENQTLFPYITQNDRQTVFSYGGELFFLWPVLFTKSELIGRMVFWLGYPVAIIGLLILLQTLNVNQLAAVMGCLVFAATPIVMKYANGLKPELWLVVFLSGTAFWLLEAIKHANRSRQYLFIAGIFTALSINVKFTALSLVPVILLITGFIAHDRNRISAVISVASGILAGTLLSGLIVPLSFNLINYGHILGPSSMRQVHASDISLRQIYTHAIRLPFLLFELPYLPSPFIRETITRWGTTTIQLLGAASPLPLENNEDWPGFFTFTLPAYANKFSTGGLIWLPVLGIGLYNLTRSLIRTFPKITLTPLHIVTILSGTLLVSIVFLIRWMVGSGLPERFLITPYALGIAVGFTILGRFIAQRRLSRIIILILVAYTVFPTLQMQWDRAKAATVSSPKDKIQLDLPFVEVLDYIPPASHILLVGSQNVPDYPLFAPQCGYANQVISWGKAPFEANRLEALIEANHITHILIENERQLDFHWDPPLKTDEMVTWLKQQPDLNEIPLTTGQMRLFETMQAKQVRLQKIEQKIQLAQAQHNLKIIAVNQSLKEKIGIVLSSSGDNTMATEKDSIEILQLNVGQLEGLQGAVWSKEFQNVLISIDVSSKSGDDSKWLIQLSGFVGGRMVTTEKSFSNSARLDFPIILKPGQNHFMLTVEQEENLKKQINTNSCCTHINLHKIIVNPLHNRDN
ncbi:MAG: glycosyltransferase family 39 protein [Anaerolineae bacterium]|nr:glycosyltransferase family 39 protein [Anaerolineae bacterium]